MSNYELKKHKKSDKVKWVAMGLAVILLAGACATTLAMGIKNNGWFKKDDTEIQQPDDQEPTIPDEGGAEVADIQGNGIKLMAARIAADDYETYGVSAQSENAYNLTATVTPADAENKAVDWTVAFEDASSSWATGKTVTDYVTVTPSADGALTAVVENKAAFGERIVVTCRSRQNLSASATCAVEYLQRTTGYTFNLDGKTYSTTGTRTHPVTPTFATTKSASATIAVNKSTVYTRANTDDATYFAIAPTSALMSAVSSAGLASNALSTYSGNKTATLSNFFDKTWGSYLHSNNNTKKNTLIAALQHFSGTAYEIFIYDRQGGTKLATFNISLNTSVIAGQKGVESITTDKSEIVF